MSAATTMPAGLEVLSGETVPIRIDFTQIVQTGASAPTSALHDITTSEPGTVITLSPAPTLTGVIVTQSVTGLTAGHKYRLTLGLTASGNVWQAGVILTCPF